MLKYVVPLLISSSFTDCIESSSRISWFLSFVFSTTVLAILPSLPSIFKTCFKPNSSTFLAKNVTVSKLAFVSAAHPSNAA